MKPSGDSHRIFVFGSNMRGRHRKGAALHAVKYYQAIEGRGFGLQNQAYALPTKGYNLEVLPLSVIGRHIGYFVRDVLLGFPNPSSQFNVTQIGCGLAGYKPREIAPFFQELTLDEDSPVYFDRIWQSYLGPYAKFWEAPI